MRGGADPSRRAQIDGVVAQLYDRGGGPAALGVRARSHRHTSRKDGSMRSRRLAHTGYTAALAAGVLAAPPRAAGAQTTPSSCDAVAGNLVANCGFESGDFGSWAVTHRSGLPNLGVSQGPNSGRFNAFFGAVGGFGMPSGYDAITQSLPTTPGQTYSISFAAVGSYFSDPQNNGLRVLFGGAPVFDQGLTFPGLQGPFGYVPYSTYVVTGVAAGTTTDLTVAAYNDASVTLVDDVVVSAAPEPGTWALLATGLLVFGGAAARRRRAA